MVGRVIGDGYSLLFTYNKILIISQIYFHAIKPKSTSPFKILYHIAFYEPANIYLNKYFHTEVSGCVMFFNTIKNTTTTTDTLCCVSFEHV